MKLDSKYFDSIRAAPKRAEEPVVPKKRKPPRCQWKGCDGEGHHRAPMGRGRDGQYFHFCLDHVRQYNATYNYFDGMSDGEIAEFQKDAVIGHRPTWKTGANAWAHGTSSKARRATTGGATVNDPNGFFAWRARKSEDAGEPRRRYVKPLERKALETLGLAHEAAAPEIKARFKELVKRHHPDVNGGDTRSADKLREVIQAYNYLKQAGLV
jgi:DnaJ-domain-containing protein 1